MSAKPVTTAPYPYSSNGRTRMNKGVKCDIKNHLLRLLGEQSISNARVGWSSKTPTPKSSANRYRKVLGTYLFINEYGVSPLISQQHVYLLTHLQLLPATTLSSNVSVVTTSGEYMLSCWAPLNVSCY